ncbi:carboxymuconolactone decarboxylase family protein [Gordonia sp. NPDC003424]
MGLSPENTDHGHAALHELDDSARGRHFEDGLRIRREIVGDEYVDAAFSTADDFSLPMQELVTEHAWGAIWSRPGLTRRERSLINLGILAALGRESELAGHVRAAVTNGATRTEIREALLQAAVYAGMPAGMSAFRVAGGVLAQLDSENDTQNGCENA